MMRMQFHARNLRVHLQIERGGFDRFLLLAREFGEAVGEGVGEEEGHFLTTNGREWTRIE